MAGYRVLLVDDEEDIRVGIGRKIDWPGLGFALAGEAENGQEALELAELFRPHVVLTDIKMPFMDGLELCRRLRTRLPASKFVVFSGFDEFEYAKQAIQMNVCEYILKPINAAELAAVLRRLKEQLDAERAQRQDMELLRRRHEENLPLLRNMFYAQLLDGRVPAAEVALRAARYDVALDGVAWVAALCLLDVGGDERELLCLSLRELFEEQFRLESCRCAAFLYSDSVALLLSFDGRPPMYALTEEIDRLCKLTRSLLGVTLTVGVGAVCDSPGLLARSVRGAREALDYRVLLGAGRGISIADLEPGSVARLSFDDEDELALSRAVKLGDGDELRAVVERLMDKIKSAGLALSQCHLYFLELLTCMLKLTRSAELDPAAVFGEDFTGALQITDFASSADLGSWCLTRCLRLQEQIGRRRTDSAWRAAERAKSFVSEHYRDGELSVDMLCAHLHLSQTYFSTLFKRETGMSFTAYVTEARMQAAAALLRTTEDKTYLIAGRVGYADPNYFSYAFKKRFGVSPKKYRSD